MTKKTFRLKIPVLGFLFLNVFSLFIFSCSSSNQTTKSYVREHDYFSELLKDWNNDSSQWKEKWWKHYLENEEFYLDISNARSVQQQFKEIQKNKLDNKTESISLLVDRVKSNYDKLRPSTEHSLSLLNTHVPIEEPLDLYWVMSIHPFNGKEFITKDKPSFAINLTFPEFDPKQTDLLFVHEAFHALHLKALGETLAPSLFNDAFGIIFREGLAVYATSVIFSGRSDEEYTFLPSEDFKKCKSNEKKYASDLLKLARTGNATSVNDNYFSSRSSKNIPPRCGYYLGYRAIVLSDNKLLLTEMIRLPQERYSHLIQNGLTKLVLKNP